MSSPEWDVAPPDEAVRPRAPAAPWRAAVDALRRPLQLAQRKASIPGLPGALSLASERVLALATCERLAAWRGRLEGFEGRDALAQQAHILEGLALLAALEARVEVQEEPGRGRWGATPTAGSRSALRVPPVRPERAPARQGEGDSGRPAVRAAAKPSERAPARPSERAPARPSEGAPARPSERAPARPSERAPARVADRELTRASDQEGRAPAKREGRAPAKPEERAPARPPAAAKARTSAEGSPPSSGSRTKARSASAPASGGRGVDVSAAAAVAEAQADDALDPLAAPTDSLRGIGPAFAARLAERGLSTVEDLLWLLPRRYQDLRAVPTLAEALARAADVTAASRLVFVAQIRSARMVFARGRRWAEVRLGSPEEPSASPRLLVRFFSLWAGLEQRMPVGARVVLAGAVRDGVAAGRLIEMANPEILELLVEPGPPTPRIATSYPDVRGVPAARLRAACQAACQRVGALADDGVPASVERACALPSLAESIAALHEPPHTLDAEVLAALQRADGAWHRRLVFGELFALGAAVALRRAQRREETAAPCPPIDAAAALGAALPFSLTAAQRRVIAELAEDLASSSPMNRLLEGDVGAGKTLVALAATLQAVRAGRQVALMAPTAVLAEQHAASWQRLASELKLRLALLTAATPRADAAALLRRLAAGELDVVIGTHALLSEGVAFARLGLCIIDEQHRFGVAQRVRLRDKGAGTSPHLLVMTATPIPRTLALTAYGDLEASILDELPPGRVPPTTRVLRGKKGEAQAVRLIAQRVAAGQRAFVVCPKIGGDAAAADDEPWRDATTVAAELATKLPRVGLVHGRLDAGARDAIMRAFRDGELDVLVATTVIEVGVDVPQATVMAIFDADRFGLSQLHQLRGRVGRGGGASDCLLLVRGEVTEEGARRLEVMTQTSDGFRIAEEDLRLRGPGELFGARQAGVPRLRFGDLRQHTELLLEARRAAEQIVRDDPRLARPEHAALRQALQRRLGQREIFGAESG
ncbi:MAG: helicase-related protein [Kofleriaceae bacterium]